LVKVPSIGDLGADRIKLESLTEQYWDEELEAREIIRLVGELR